VFLTSAGMTIAIRLKFIGSNGWSAVSHGPGDLGDSEMRLSSTYGDTQQIHAGRYIELIGVTLPGAATPRSLQTRGRG
jgi:hypothetical protein